MLQVQDKVKVVRSPRLVGLQATDHCRLCEHLNPYGNVASCTEQQHPATLCVFGTDCRYYVRSPQCFACGIIIRPSGSSSVAVPLAGTKGGVTCESCAETLKERGFFRYGVKPGKASDSPDRRWYPGDGMVEEIADSTPTT